MKLGINLSNQKKEYSIKEIPINIKEDIFDLFYHCNKKEIKICIFGDHPEFPERLYGNDLDILVDDFEFLINQLRARSWVLKREISGGFRAFKLTPNCSFFVLDILSPRAEKCRIKQKIYNDALFQLPVEVDMNSHHVKFVSPKYMITFKLYSYLYLGYVHSKYQVEGLHRKFHELSEFEQQGIKQFFVNLKIDSVLSFLSVNEIDWNKLSLEIEQKRKRRFSRRLVFRGKFYSLNIVKALIYSCVKKGFSNNYSIKMPYVAVVGNDGSGKTSLCEKFLLDEFKIDPVHINMRANGSWFKFWLKARPFLRRINKICSKNFIFFPVAKLIFIFSELFDFFDRYLRFFVGRTIADNGIGLVIFERYPTDRLRGEYYPNRSIFPLEKFFPMPDAIVYLDVTPENSLMRKPKDGHTFCEMTEKRDNYRRLIAEISRTTSIDANTGMELSLKEFKRYLFSISLEKQSNEFFKSACWRPDKISRRKLKLNPNAKQKDGFL